MPAHKIAPQSLPTSSVGRLIYHHPVAAFLALVYGISWIIYIPSFLSESGIGVLPFELSPLPFNLLAVIFGITFSAYVVTRVTQGREGVRQLRSHHTRWRVGIGWYLLVLFALPIAVVVGAAVWQGTEPLRTFVDRWELVFTAFLPNALLIAVLISLWEEGGWTGFLLPRLQEIWGPLVASAMVAAAQGLFHVPLIPIIGGVSDERIPLDEYWLYVVALLVLTIPVRVLMTWLWNSTRGSVIIVALFHGAFNTTTGDDFTPEFVPGETLWVYAVYAGLALAVIVLTKGRLAYQDADRSRSVDAGHRHEESPGPA